MKLGKLPVNIIKILFFAPSKNVVLEVALDGSEDTDINICGLDGYVVGTFKAATNRPESSGSDDSDSTESDSGPEVPSHIQLGGEVV